MSLLKTPLLIVWALLVASTLASLVVTDTQGAAAALHENVPGIAVLVIAFVKVYLVMHYFMELRHAPLAWAWTFGLWTLGALLLLTVLFVST